jgi:hypothetical protein
MRPEVRRWGPPAGVFGSADTAIDLLTAISKVEPEIEMSFTDDVSSDAYLVFWPDGDGILDRFDRLDDDAIGSIASGVEHDPDAPSEFLENLRACAESWREFLDPEDRSFELLVDV